MQNFLDKNSQFFFSFYFDKDLGVVCEKLTTAVKVLAKASIIYQKKKIYYVVEAFECCILLFLLRTWIDLSLSLVHNWL